MSAAPSPLSEQHRLALEGNLRRFVVFRLFYSARFYYPVFTILFLDYGLTLAQFALLNMAWALAIVVAEVPSGALADIVGRRRLVIFAALMMVLEMSLLAFVPMGASSLLFGVFLLNRLISGLSEAAASGRTRRWPMTRSRPWGARKSGHAGWRRPRGWSPSVSSAP
jgi:MFS family permease